MFLFKPRSAQTPPDATGAQPEPVYTSAAERIKATGQYNVDDVALLANTHERYDFAPGTPWDDFRGSTLALPDWFRHDLDPMSMEFAEQQHKLWRLLAGVERIYEPVVDEKEAALAEVDAIRFPGHFVRRDPQAVEYMAEHFLGTAMVLRHSGIAPGQWALEYGAGFAQTALQLARLGVNVDTVDISAEFCKHVQTQSEFYRVPLTPFQDLFGSNPRGDKKYDLIWFYESFHHCVDFRNVVHSLKNNLSPTGRVLLAGEPIRPREDRYVPYPWGIRLDSENVAVVRYRHWFELGFSEDFLVTLFTNAGFVAERKPCEVSPLGEVYIFRLRPNTISMSNHWLPNVEREGWHGLEPHGRWTAGAASLALDTTESFSSLEIEATNHLPVVQPVEVVYGEYRTTERFQAGERRVIKIDARKKAAKLTLNSKTIVPKSHNAKSVDTRALGIYVHEIRYVQ